jgi:hypothetical protein
MRVLGEALALWLYEQGVREDILGSSIKAAWLQSGLGGVKIETASMLPDPIRPDPPRDAEESVIRPSPRVEPGDGLDSDRAPVDEVAPDTKETAASVPDTQSESVPDSRRGSLNPLARQAQELRRLVLASIGVTALLALAVVVLLWDQHRTTRAVTTPTAALPPASVVSVPAPKPFAAPTASTHSVPEASADPSRLEEADAGTSETSAPSAPRPVSRPAPRRRHGRTKERNPEYELGF